MRILFFSPYFYPYTSGITIYPYIILTHLAKNHEITILTFQHKRSLPNFQLTNQLKIIRMPYLFKVSKGFISPQLIFYFIKHLKKKDLIILNIPNFEGLLLAILAKIVLKPVISIFHCQVILESNNPLIKIINYLLNLSTKIQLNLSDKIIVYEDYINSLSYFKKFKNKTAATLPPIRYLGYNKRFLKRLLKMKKDNIWIGYCGRVSSEKGLKYLIENFPSNKMEIVFAGPYGEEVAGESSYYQKIKNLLELKKIKYHFFGYLAEKDLGAFYKAIDVLVLPSINQTEAFSMVQAEAMLLGTPVVATNLPGVRVPIKLTKMGLLVKPKNSLQLIKAIKKILKNKKKYSNKKLIKHAKRIFNIKKVYQFYKKIINNLNHEKN